jgi:serine/threonine protein kinase
VRQGNRARTRIKKRAATRACTLTPPVPPSFSPRRSDIYSLGIALYATLKRTAKPLGQLEYIPEIWDRVGRPTFLADCRINLERRKRLLGDGREDRWNLDPVAPDTVDFVLSMLALNPAVRPSAAELLASPYFDGIRAEARALFGHERGDADGAAVGAGGEAAGGAAGGAAAAP